jgi:hypothetical protein
LHLIEFMNKEKEELNYGLMDSLGITNKQNDVFVYIDFTLLYDEYKNKPIADTDILIVTTKNKENLLENLPNNKGAIFSNLIFKPS